MNISVSCRYSLHSCIIIETEYFQITSKVNTMSSSLLDALKALAIKYELSEAEILSLYQSIAWGKGRMAQFNMASLRGPGQWMQNGMVMVGDPSDQELKAKVDALCRELADLWTSHSRA